MINVTGQIQPMALANLIHSAPSSNGIAFSVTLKNIRDCIALGDEWFIEPSGNEFRVSTNSGFSAIVKDKGFLSYEGRRIAA